MKIKVESARLDEEQVIFDASLRYVESMGRDDDIDQEGLKKTIRSLIADANSCAYVAKSDGNIVGVVAATLVKPPFFETKYCVEVAWHCSDDLDLRVRYYIMGELLSTMEAWAEGKEAKKILISTDLDSSVGRYLEKSGYVSSEMNFMKEVG